MERARGGDPRAFEEIVRSHADATYRIAAAMIGASHAEDVVQETFLRVHRGLPRFRGESRLRTWIYRIATNVSLTRRGRMAARPAEPLGDADPVSTAPGPDAESVTEERKALLRRALDQLPEHQRAVVILRVIEGLSFEETARILGIRRPTAESRMARAKDRLRQILEPVIGAEEMA